MQKSITLTCFDKQLLGKYQEDAEHLFIVLDTSALIPFTVYLPDLKLPANKEFQFKNLPFGTAGAIVTISTINGQLIDGRDYTHAVNPFDFLAFRTDLRRTWVLMDVNY
jgi:hypothetical protein